MEENEHDEIQMNREKIPQLPDGVSFETGLNTHITLLFIWKENVN